MLKNMYLRYFTVCVCGAAASAVAQPYPVKVIRMVVPFAPGGNTDIIARFIVPKMSEDLGQQIIIDNRGGAGGNIGAEAVARELAERFLEDVGLRREARQREFRRGTQIGVVVRVMSLAAGNQRLCVFHRRELFSAQQFRSIGDGEPG